MCSIAHYDIVLGSNFLVFVYCNLLGDVGEATASRTSHDGTL